LSMSSLMLRLSGRSHDVFANAVQALCAPPRWHRI
jgi:hypothetical protein